MDMANETLAAKLGTTAHLSPLLRKAARYGLDASGLELLAIQRGCDYYHDGRPLPPASVSEKALSNEELAVALLNPSLRYHPQTLRLGAAMLGTEGNDPIEIARLAKLERAERIVRYVAAAGLKYEPDNPFWATLLELLPLSAPPDSSVVPHPTRFIAMTGVTRRGLETVTQWIRPNSALTRNG
jgi:hypothetical protein